MSIGTTDPCHTDSFIGGIVALGLGVKRWSIAECQAKLTLLSQRIFCQESSFTTSLSRATKGWSGTVARAARFLWYGNLYDERTLETVMQDAFGAEDLLAARESSDLRVAVTATTNSNPPCDIFTTYDKQEHGKERAYGWPDHEMAGKVRIWEA